MTKAKQRSLKILVQLTHGKEARNIMEPRWKKPKPGAVVAKTGLTGFGYWSILFFRKDRV
jgi:hypothetical protein